MGVRRGIPDQIIIRRSLANWRRSNNDDPAFTDAEVITIALMQGYFQTDTLKRTYQLVSKNAPEAFPMRPGYKQWVRRLNRLTDLVGRLVRAAALQAAAKTLKRLYVVDSFPIPLCQPVRHGRVRLLSEDGAYFGRSAKGWFFGFQVHALIHQPTGAVLTAILLPGNWDDRRAVRALALSTAGGILLGDQGYSGKETFDWLYDEAQTLRVMPSDEKKEGLSTVSQVRQRIESSFSGLWRRFADRVYSRSWRGLWTSLLLKILDFNMERAGIIETV
ncbi:IS982 family transposase [Salinibacter ruber]|uniref:IS982 family transposase n=1 Tax=Salinibacter ruber TaxID=146919 RepID=UPI0023430326|nr:IS982 family transposase [Salinibacter ruber]